MGKVSNYFLVLLTSAFFCSGILISCEESVEVVSVNEEDIAQEAIEDFENYRLKLTLLDSHRLEFPSPVELAKNYKNTGIQFIPGLTNPAADYGRYITNTKKSLNFGVYSADLSYCVLNQQGQCASEYFIAIQNISNKIGLSEIFRYELILTDFSSSLGDKDSMSRMVAGIQKDLDKTLRANGTQDKAILFYTGAWIESAYIAINAKKDFSNTLDTAMVTEITSQVELLEDILIEFDKMEEKNQEVMDLQNKLLEFKEISTGIRFKTSGDSIVLNLQDLQKIRSKIEEIRAYVVS
ncbi:hypothetical protein N9D34_01175 [Salibacteraceae bacterium]|nr:hypothetical protein [Salibacteraceae bacterium]